MVIAQDSDLTISALSTSEINAMSSKAPPSEKVTELFSHFVSDAESTGKCNYI